MSIVRELCYDNNTLFVYPITIFHTLRLTSNFYKTMQEKTDFRNEDRQVAMDKGEKY